MQQGNVNKDYRVLFGDIFIAPSLGPALGYLTAMCSPGWGNLVAFDWNDLPVGREFDCKFFKNVKSPPHALPPDLHAHTWEPPVLVHTAFTSQLSVLVAHSSISEGRKKTVFKLASLF